MTDREKILKAWERCGRCTFPSVFGDQTAYLECEYTTGQYCRQDKLRIDTLELIKGQPDIVRCRDCKYSLQDPETLFYRCEHPFGLTGMPHGAEWYCADGERKTK